VDAARGLWAEPLCGCVPRDLLDAAPVELRHDEEEATRLAYVAATRARDLLVVPVVGDERVAGWVDVLDPAVHPAPERRRESSPAPGCPAFGEDSVLERPASCRLGTTASVRPGLHRPEAGEHRVAWWDPAALDLDVEEAVGLRQHRILAADETGVAAEHGRRAHDAWQAARGEALARGGAESIRVRAVTALATEGEVAAPAHPIGLEEVTVGDRTARPGGKRFGTLVHATLAAVDLDADEARVHATTRSQARLVGASADEVEAAARAVHAALAHPLLRSAGRAAVRGELRRETPVLLRLPDGGLAEGKLDLAFRDDEREQGPAWTVLDFKTDRELAARRAEYEAQLRLYVEAVARATGEPARGLLLVV
jgi:ATP-dependent exoDNAse (exonuclease V) beta subunit